MNRLQQLSQENLTWTLDEFVQIANELLPQFLPNEKAHTRVREEVSSRLIRHYASQKLLDEPLKMGREARYTYRHLLQVLFVRRLLIEGYGASAIDTLARSKNNEELEALLHGGVQLTVSPANPALAFLQQIQQRPSSNLNPPKAAPAPPPPAPAPRAAAKTTWIRLEVLPGLELHVRSDFALPSTPQEQHNVLHHLFQALISMATSNRRSSKP